MIQRYDEIDAALTHLCEILGTDRTDNRVYVPAASTVRLLRRANALCARNMVACDFYVESGSPASPSAKPKRPKRRHGV